jgi:hypothetical protein
MLLEIGFITFIVVSYIYFLHSETILSMYLSLYRLLRSAITIGLVASGAYYFYKNPDQLGLLRDFISKRK